MQPFTIKNRISKKEYRDFIRARMYRQPIVLILSLVGTVCVLVSILLVTNLIPNNFHSFPVIPVLFIGAFTAALPFIIAVHANSSYDKTPAIHSETVYHFTENGITVTIGELVNTISWKDLRKIEETKSLVLLFTDKTGGHAVQKQALSQEQIRFIKSKIKDS